MEPNRTFQSPQGPGGTAGEEGFTSVASFPDLDVFNREEIAFSPSTVDATFESVASKEQVSSPVGVVHEPPSSPGILVEEGSSGPFQTQLLPAAAHGAVGGGTDEWRPLSSSSSLVPIVPTVPEGDKPLLLPAGSPEATSLHDSGGPTAASEFATTGLIAYGLTSMEPESSFSPHVMNLQAEEEQVSNSPERSADAVEESHPDAVIPQQLDAEAVEASHQVEIPQLDVEGLEASHQLEIPQQLDAEAVEASPQVEIPQLDVEGLVASHQPEIPQQLDAEAVAASPQVENCQLDAEGLEASHQPEIPQQLDAEAVEASHQLEIPQLDAEGLEASHQLEIPQQLEAEAVEASHQLEIPQQFDAEDFEASHQVEIPEQLDPEDFEASHQFEVLKQVDAEELEVSYQLEHPQPLGAEALEASRPPAIPLSLNADAVEAFGPPTIPQQLAASAVEVSRQPNASQQLAEVPSSGPMDGRSSPADPVIAPLSPVVSKSAEAKEQLLNSAEPCADAMELSPSHELSRSSEAKEQLPSSAEPCADAMELPLTQELSRSFEAKEQLPNSGEPCADAVELSPSHELLRSSEAKEQLPSSAEPCAGAMELPPSHELSQSFEAKEQLPSSAEPSADAMELPPTHELSQSSEAKEQLPISAEPSADAKELPPTHELSRPSEAKELLPNSAEPCADAMELSPSHEFSRSSEAKEQLPYSAEPCADAMELSPTEEFLRSSKGKEQLSNSAETSADAMELSPIYESCDAKEQLPNSAEPCPEAMLLPPTHENSRSSEAKEQLPNSTEPCSEAVELPPTHEISRSSEAKEQLPNSAEPCLEDMELPPTHENSRSSEAKEQLPNSAEPCSEDMELPPTHESSRLSEAKEQLPISAEPCSEDTELPPTHENSRSSEAKEQLPNPAEPCSEDMELPPTHENSRSSEAKEHMPNSAEPCSEDMELPPTQEDWRSPEAKEQLPNPAEPCPEAMELLPTDEISRPPPETSELATANGSESGLKRCEAHEDEEHEDEGRPAKRAKNGIVYTGAAAVSAILGQTAEIVLVLAGMAQMRAGRTPTSYERELATTAYQNLGILVSRVTPNHLVARESVEKMRRDFDMKKAAQKRRQEQAWHDAVTEAEALANARVEAIARAKADAAARAQAEAKEVERVRQAAMTAAALAANDPSRCGFSPAAVPPLSSGQSESFASGVVQSPSLSTPAAHPSPQAQTVSQSPVSKAADVARSTPPEKCVSINGLSQSPGSRPGLAKPPKIRNRARKDPAAVAFYAPDLLTQDQSQDPQKSQFTHKQLCLGVQRFIRDHVPQAPQTLQALPPTYISKPEPCQICKLIAPDTESVLVCDTCDEVSHVKCVNPNPSKWDPERDWNCSKCIMANRGYDCPSKYGPIRRGAPNSVTLWPPHETSEDYRETTSGAPNGSIKGRGESIRDGRRVNPGLKVQRKTSLEINTDSRPSHDDHNIGNLGNSPHLVVHLVNEPSPRPSASLDKSSHLLRGDNRRPFPSAQTTLPSVQDLPTSKMVPVGGATESQMAPMGEIAKMLCNPSDSLRMPVTEMTEKGLGKSDNRYGSLAECAKQEARKNQAQIEKPETKIKIIGSKKGDADSSTTSSANLAEKEATVSNPVAIEWVGGSIRQAEGKVYYRACRVGGITFSVSDCALFTPEPPDVAPYIARLQVLWEDIATGHKWVRVSWCYYPSDIPLAMDRPGSTNPNEVYESNHCDDNLIGSIKGPCFVLPPTKFREEVERRNTFKKGREAVDELPPLFLCRWMYDASKVVFRPLQE